MSGAKFEARHSNISRDVLIKFIVLLSCTTYDVITFLICIYTKTLVISEVKNIPKRKMPFFVLKKRSNKECFSFISKALK